MKQLELQELLAQLNSAIVLKYVNCSNCSKCAGVGPSEETKVFQMLELSLLPGVFKLSNKRNKRPKDQDLVISRGWACSFVSFQHFPFCVIGSCTVTNWTNSNTGCCVLNSKRVRAKNGRVCVETDETDSMFGFA